MWISLKLMTNNTIKKPISWRWLDDIDIKWIRKEKIDQLEKLKKINK